MLFQSCIDSNMNFVLSQELDAVNRFSNLSSSILAGGRISGEVSLRIRKALLALTSLRPITLRDLRLPMRISSSSEVEVAVKLRNESFDV